MVIEPTTDTESPLSRTRDVRGRRFLALIAAVLALVVAVNYAAAQRNRRIDARTERDADIVADPARTIQTWSTVADGTVLTARSAQAGDDATMASIRRTLQANRIRHLRGDFGPQPSRLAAQGADDDASIRASLEFGTINGLLNVRYRTLPDGAMLHFVTTDAVMKTTLAEWVRS